MRIKSVTYQESIKKIIQSVPSFPVLSGSSVLITGASGMVGTVVVDCLMLANQLYGFGIRVFALGRSAEHAKERFFDYFEDNDFRFITADVNRKLPEMGDFDYIIHSASNTHPIAYSQDPIGTITANVLGTYNILEYMVNHPVRRFVFLSSVEIYGENRGDVEKFSEEDCGYIDCNTVRAGYPEGKRVGESLCCAFEKQYGIDVVIPRLCRLYGPTMNWNDSKALSQFIKKAVYQENIVLKSEGNQQYSYLFVSDAVSAIFRIMLEGKKGQAYNVASEESDICLKNLAEKLAFLGNSRVVFELPDEIERRGFSKATKALLNNKKLRDLGWSEQYTLDEGLKISVENLRSLYK
ncbi:MAG: NAD-dependent epimerase/dehydratase family protein [Enterocloster bolteae]|uniref:NAD-dependent epimerase/dehydratase family protein n=1 Tax=Enterocloster bolteae TaxID=208479 RepID=UPI0039955C57